MSLPSVTVVGHVTHDLYGDEIVAGGCAYYGARVYRALGIEPCLITLVGRDFRCDEALAGIDVEMRRDGQTTIFSNVYPDEGPRRQYVRAVAPDISPPADASTLETDVVHLAPVLGELELAPWKHAAREAGILGINVQGWIKRPGEPGDDGSRPVIQRPWDVTIDELRGIDVACVSEEDLIDQGDLLQRLLAAIPVVALTRGGDGSEIFVDGRRHTAGVYPTRVADPTGAGDTFAASFLFRLASGDPPVQAAKFASAAASIVIEGRGGETIARLSEAVERAGEIESRRDG